MAERVEEAYGVLATLVYGDEKNQVLNGVVTSDGVTLGELLSKAWDAPGKEHIGSLDAASAVAFGKVAERVGEATDMADTVFASA